MTPPGRETGQRGRPLLLTDEAHRRICEALRAGVPVYMAAQAAAVSDDSIARWMKKGQAVEKQIADGEATEADLDEFSGAYLQFFREATKARAEGGVRDVLLIQKAAAGGYVTRRTTKRYRDPDGRVVEETVEDVAGPDWRAAAKVLDSSYGWSAAAQAMQLELTGPGGGPVQVEVDVAAVAARAAQNIRVLSQRGFALESGTDDDEAGESGDHG